MKSVSCLNIKENERKALQELKEKLLKDFPEAKIILYGSKARGEGEEFSDVDLLILIDAQVTRMLKEEIIEITYNIELKYEVVFGTIIENIDFWKSPLANAMPLHWNIDKEGILL